jgi:2-polyprenyl-3-methyl-5-hydroxy-6-metoxy-1,4-benzoquinol methylase
MGYADHTFKDKNFFKRSLQSKRLKVVSDEFASGLKNDAYINVLDYGCGNAELFKYLSAELENFTYTGYDPHWKMIEDSASNLGISGNTEQIRLTSNKADILDKKFDAIFCLEVFEHLPHETLIDELKTISSLLTDTGVVYFGVPNEIYFAALIKGAFRMSRRYGEFDANLKNYFSAVLGKPPANRRTPTDTETYHYYHMGFDHRSFIKNVKKFFTVEAVFGSPNNKLPILFNMEVYIRCRKFAAAKSM